MLRQAGIPTFDLLDMEQIRPHLMSTREAQSFIERAAWTSAKSTEDVAPHQYVVKGWNRDDITEEEFWAFTDLVKTRGREEIWTPPAEWIRRWGGRPMTNRYLYLGEYAYWFTWPRNSVPMLNREHSSVQTTTPTRTAIGDSDETRRCSNVDEAPTPTTAEEWERTVKDWDWTFARTMPQIPHWYVVRRRHIDDFLWKAFAKFIADNGFQGVWTAPSGYQREGTYCRLGAWQYWVIDDVINRDVLADSNVVRVKSDLA